MESDIIEEVSENPSLEDYPVSVNWVQKNQFIAKDDQNHAIVIDTPIESHGDGTGMTPGRLLLAAVAGCTSIDVVDILKKSRQELIGLTVSAKDVQADEFPKYYREINLFYTLRGKSLDKSKVERAIRLSEEKYCSVGATVRGKAKISIKYKIEDVAQPNNSS